MPSFWDDRTHHHLVYDDGIALAYDVQLLKLDEYPLGLVEFPTFTESNGGHIPLGYVGLEDSESIFIWTKTKESIFIFQNLNHFLSMAQLALMHDIRDVISTINLVQLDPKLSRSFSITLWKGDDKRKRQCMIMTYECTSVWVINIVN